LAKKELPEVFTDYLPFLDELKNSIRQAQIKAGLSVNRELVLLYWQIGKGILNQQATQGWGSNVIGQLAEDLKKSFPEMKGFSPRNLKYMRAFADAYPDLAFVQAAPAQITWYHNCTLLDKVKDPSERQFYTEQTIVNGWSRDVLVHQIESGLHTRQGGAITNFANTLPKPQSELAQQILKDPYNLEFLTLAPEALERDLERSLLEKLKDFLLELGTGFSFVGSQYHLEVGGQDYFLDLLFYHLKMRCFVIVDLKITDFKPEYAGKMGFYLAVADDQLRHETDQPSVGLILCKTRNSVVAEYTLRNSANPMGVSEYKVAQALPASLKASLPTIETLERELAKPFMLDESLLDGPDVLE
jgi:predicted nuclease of restriction endonuclease-like (RecB) superfamily